METLRPCIIKKKERVETVRYGDGRREKIVMEPSEEHKGHFHMWHEAFWTVGRSAYIGGASEGQMSELVGLVEYEDGTLHYHSPGEIQFTDMEDQIAEAAAVLRDELLKHEELWDCFKASAASAIREKRCEKADCTDYELADAIIRRIAGDET